MNNLERIFLERRKKEIETRLTYSKYIFNSHLIMFLIIVIGAIMINYSRWLDIASSFELHAVLLATLAIFSYLIVSSKIKTFLKEADSVFLLPLEKYYRSVALKTTLRGTISQILLLIIFYFSLIPIINKIGEISGFSDIIGIIQLVVLLVLSRLYRLLEVIYFEERLWSKVIFFFVIYIQTVDIILDVKYLKFLNLILIIIVAIMFFNKIRSGQKTIFKDMSSYFLLNWTKAAEYDKHRNENYLKFVNMFVDVPLSGIKVARRKYFDIILPKLTYKNFTKENSFTYYYYRVFLRQENTVFLVLRLLLISSLIIYSFGNYYVSGIVIISFSYLTVIQLVPLYKQISNNIWHSILPISEEIKTKSFKKLLTVVMLISTLILTVLSVLFTGFDIEGLEINIGAFILANLLNRVFIKRIK